MRHILKINGKAFKPLGTALLDGRTVAIARKFRSREAVQLLPASFAVRCEPLICVSRSRTTTNGVEITSNSDIILGSEFFCLPQLLSESVATILCVDDEDACLQARKLLLEAHGYRVLQAKDGAAGLALFETNHIDLVITDHLLPGMRGAELAKRMKQIKPSVPVAVLTGLSEPPQGIEYADCFLVKGDDVREQLRKIADLLRSSSQLN